MPGRTDYSSDHDNDVFTQQPNRLILCFDGTGNVFRGTPGDTNIVKLYGMIEEALATNDMAMLKQAQELSRIVARADWCVVKGGIPGTKWALSRFYYEYGVARSPLPGPSGNVEFFLWLRRGEATVDDADIEAVVSAGPPGAVGERVDE